MQLGPFLITRKKSATNLITQWPAPARSWWSQILGGEHFAGAWQRGLTVPVQDALAHPVFWSCVTLIASDIAKLRPKLIEEDADGICDEVENPAYSPVLRRPNRYQNRIQFYMNWILSKLTRGNAYALKARDGRSVVTSLYLLDPTRVQPMVSPLGEVFYAVQQDPLNGVTEPSIVVPAREIIHDTMYAIYHPLVGLPPLYACGHVALQGLTAISNSSRLSQQSFQPGGIVTAVEPISPEAAKKFEDYWQTNYAGPENIGRIVVLGGGLKFEKPPVMSAVDAQLIEQLQWGDAKICSTLHVPGYMVGVGDPPNYNNIEALNQQYYSQGLQILIESLELHLKEGLDLKETSYVEFDLEALLRMDSATKMKTATDGVKGGIYTPNEARRPFNLKPLAGGDTVYLQQQDYSIEALAARDAAGPAPASTSPGSPSGAPPAPPDSEKHLTTKEMEDMWREELVA